MPGRVINMALLQPLVTGEAARFLADLFLGTTASRVQHSISMPVVLSHSKAKGKQSWELQPGGVSLAPNSSARARWRLLEHRADLQTRPASVRPAHYETRSSAAWRNFGAPA